jgi:DNA-binding IclR family transcriptional regulator
LDRSSEESRYTIRAVTRAIDLLNTVADAPGPSDLSDLARQARLPVSTTLRYLESMRQRGFIRQTAGGKYTLGSRLFELGSTFTTGMSLWEHSQEIARELADRAKETVSVGILDEGQVLYIAIVNAQRELGIQWRPGTRHPAHCTALGKAILASMPWDAVEAVLDDHPLERRTKRTITDRGELRYELEISARRGFAIDNEERAPGVICVGAAIRDFSGDIAGAISVSAPTVRLTPRKIDAYSDLVRASAEEASRRLGAIYLEAR